MDNLVASVPVLQGVPPTRSPRLARANRDENVHGPEEERADCCRPAVVHPDGHKTIEHNPTEGYLLRCCIGGFSVTLLLSPLDR